MKKFCSVVQRVTCSQEKKFSYASRQVFSSCRVQTAFCTMSAAPSTSRRTEPVDLEKSKKKYEEAVKKLNMLQTSAEEMEKIRKVKGAVVKRVQGPDSLVSMQKYLERCGIMMEDINELPIIHIAGTKGKGSVCAFCESILRSHGLKTGLITSPHLIEVRERIRINGKPIDHKTFADYFQRIHSLMEMSKPAFKGEMPMYNKMTFVMGIFILLDEKVDVAILEVGCGGEYDYTNFIRKPIVTGITPLGLDHMATLGDTLAKIAWHKAGIFKPGIAALTVPQPIEAMDVIASRARELETTVQCVPPLESNNFGNILTPKLGLPGRHQLVNASLAVKLCQKFLEVTKGTSFDREVPTGDKAPTEHSVSADGDGTGGLSAGVEFGIKTSDPIVLPEYFISGLRDCYWPGRSQTIMREQVTYYLDGAHTARSLQACVDWFLEASGEEQRNTKGTVLRILLFNIKLWKYKPSLVKPLLDCKFDAAVFCPNLLYEDENPPDMACRYRKREDMLANSQEVKQLFESLLMDPGSSQGDTQDPSLESGEEPMDVDGAGHLVDCTWLPSISSALSWAACGRDPSVQPLLQEDVKPVEKSKEAARIQVLVTGSLYLVGGVLKLLDPDLAD